MIILFISILSDGRGRLLQAAKEKSKDCRQNNLRKVKGGRKRGGNTTEGGIEVEGIE